MIYGSICSGIEAASVAWHPLGWRPAFFSEIDAFPRAVLAHHHPHVPLHGDFTTIEADQYAAIDVLVGGTPCQSFSVAGLRAGLADQRGNLALEFCRLARRLGPRWVVWENVPGVLSLDGGRAFASILGGLAECGYGLAYRVLDAQFVRVDGFGRAVPQRRRRVFVVGCLGSWQRAAAVLFERASLRGDSAPRRQAGQGAAPTLAARTRGGGGLGTEFDCDGGLVAHTLNAKGGAGRSDSESETFLVEPVAHALRADGFDASEDGTGRGTPLTVCFDETQITSADNRCNPQPGDPCHPLVKGGRAPTICFSAKDSGLDAMSELAPTLRAGGFDKSHANAGVMPAIAYSIRADAMREGSAKTPSADAEGRIRLRDPGMGVYEEHAPTLDTGQAHAVTTGWRVRRLLPVECERLQGFPDGYTAIPYRGKPAADGPRYKALGNSMAVNVMRWIGRRIEAVEAIRTSAAA